MLAFAIASSLTGPPGSGDATDSQPDHPQIGRNPPTPHSLGTNTSWAKRIPEIGVLMPGAKADTIYDTESHYVVLTGSRKVDDDPGTAD